MVAKLSWEAVGVGGLVMIGVGLWWVYPPLAMIAGGVALVRIGWQGAK